MTDPARATDEAPVDVDHVIAPLREPLHGAVSRLATLAVRRTRMRWWQQRIAVAGLVGVGPLVVGIKTIAH